MIFKTTPNQSAENLSLDMAEDAKVESGTSSIARSDKNSPRDMAEHAEVGGHADGGDDKTIKRSFLSKKPNGFIGYLTPLRSNADSAPFEKRWAHLIILTIIETPS